MVVDEWNGLGRADQFSRSQEYLIDDTGQVSPAVYGTHTQSGTNSSPPAPISSPPAPTSSTPPPTLIGASGSLQFDLIWDSSVAKAPSGFVQAIIKAAQFYTTFFSNKEVVNIDVGYGEVDGSRLASSALGESESYGYLTNLSTVVNALHSDSYPPSLARNEPTSSQFFVTRAEAKTLDLISGSSSGVDGFVGLSSTVPMNYSTSGPTQGSPQFDATAIAEHEISEVMGRIGMEGEIVSGKPTYTPLDLFDYKSPGILELSGLGGYFSVNDGTSNLGIYNDASAHGGDISDWASNAAPTGVTYDAYNAFTWPGYHGIVSSSDLLEDAALGYKLTPTGVATA